ncbi:ABC-2 type transporter family protein [Asticcacaulis biprosthecium C19]|uniref:ABC-2 type transporter family protein n=1 Tax=Asticcacaulis biprosthecium C19 TaxID=715226 RepID=F4QLZ8_9CAUL|nr:ABC transporter permease [Asticcacaulis biprosthecium]EGF93570.1 ABC-2 type transporter family protein [Asticcacaulis biprosthecium C19]
MNKTFADLGKGLGLYRVWFYQAYHELTGKYRRTFLGPFWISGGMIVTSICLSVVFGPMMGGDLRLVLPYIMGGILCFGMVSFILIDGTEMFLRHGGNIKNHAYPFTYYTLETMAKEILLFLNNVVVFYVVMVLIRAAVVPHWSIVLGFAVVIMTGLTWGSVFGIIAARFRDLRFMLPYLNQLMFFLTPIFWRPESVRGHNILVKYNPYYGLLEIMRAPLLGEAASAHMWYLALGAMVTGIIAWLVVFSLFRRRIPFWV